MLEKDWGQKKKKDQRNTEKNYESSLNFEQGLLLTLKWEIGKDWIVNGKLIKNV